MARSGSDERRRCPWDRDGDAAAAAVDRARHAVGAGAGDEFAEDWHGLAEMLARREHLLGLRRGRRGVDGIEARLRELAGDAMGAPAAPTTA